MSIRPSHHNFAGNTQNTSATRMQKMRERFNRWEQKANERKSTFIERQKARIERYREAFKGSWISKIGLGMVAIWNFITNPPFVVSIEKRPAVAFTAMLPFGVRIGKNSKRSEGKRKSVTRNRLSPEALEQRQLLAADFDVSAGSQDEFAALYQGTAAADDAPTGIVQLGGTVNLGSAADAIDTVVTEQPGDASAQNLIDNDGTLNVEDVDFVKKQSGAGFIGGTGAVTIDGDSTFTIVVEEHGFFTIDLDILNDFGSGTVSAPGTGSVTYSGSGASWEYEASSSVEGPATDSFAFTDGAFSGVINVQITALNDVPELDPPAVADVTEGGSTGALTGFTVTDADAGSVVTVTVGLSEDVHPDFQGETTPFNDSADFTDGTLTLSPTAPATATPLGAGFTIVGSPADVQATLNTLEYAAAGDFFGEVDITFTIEDAESTGASSIIEFNVTNDNDPLVEVLNTGEVIAEGGTNLQIKGRTGGTGLGAGADLIFGDSETNPADVVYTVTSVSSNGTLRRVSPAAVLEADDTFTQADLDANRIRFDHNGGEPAVEGFEFDVSTADDLITGQTFAITVTQVNDAPIPVDDDVETEADTLLSGNLLNDNGNGADSDPEGDGFNVSTLSSGAIGVQHLLGDGLLTVNANGTFTFDPNGGYDDLVAGDTEEETFTYKISDGTDESADATVTITITGVNEGPVLVANSPLSVSEGAATTTIANSNLEFDDADDVPSDLVYEVTSVPSNGTVKLSGVTVGMGMTFTQQDINDSLVSYGHDGSETTSDSFGFEVSDGVDTVSGTFNLVVLPVNDEQSLDVNTGTTVDEAGTKKILSTALSTSDVDNTSSQVAYTVTAGPLNGQLEFVGDPGVAITSFTQEDIDNELVQYVHDGSETSDGSFDFDVDDGVGAVTSDTFSITVTPVNDPVVAIDADFTTEDVNEDDGFSETVGGFIPIDALATDDDDVLTPESFTGTGASFSLDGGMTTTAFADLASGGFTYDPVSGQLDFDPTEIAVFQALAPGDSALVTIDFDVTDGTTTDSGTATFEVDGVNDDSVLTTGDFSVAEGEVFPITTAHISVVDPDTDPADIDIQISVGTPGTGDVRVSGLSATTFTYQDVLDGVVTYVDSSTGAGSNVITVDVSDSVAFSSDDTDTINVTVTEINDIPVVTVTDAVATFDEAAATAVAIATSVSVSDPDDTTLSSATVSIEGGGVDDDVLAIDGTSFAAMSDEAALAATASYDSMTGTLTISGVYGISVYEAVLAKVTFENTGDNPSDFGAATSRTINFLVNDGEDDSDAMAIAAQATVGITAENDGPTVTSSLPMNTLTYNEGFGTTTIDNSLEIVDADNEELTEVTVSISGYVDTDGEDTFSLTNVADLDDAGLTTPVTIFGDVDLTAVAVDGGAGTIVLTLSGTAMGVASIEDFEAAIQSLSYSNSSEDPATTDRTISIVANDGSDPSMAEVITISVQAENDAPVLSAATDPAEMTIDEDSRTGTANYIVSSLSPGAGSPILEVLDADDDPIDLVYKLTAIDRPDLVELEYDNGAMVGGNTPLGIGDTFTQADIDATVSTGPGGDRVGPRVRSLDGIDASPGNNVAVLTFDVSDGVNTISVDLTVNIIQNNDRPVRDGSNAVVNTLTVAEEVDGTPADTIIPATNLTWTDEEDEDATLIFELYSLPSNGSKLIIDGVEATQDLMTMEITPKFTRQDVIDGKIVYRHADTDQESGTDTFTYRVEDNEGLLNTGGSQTFTLNIEPANDSPIPGDDAVSGSEDASSITGDVLVSNTVMIGMDTFGDAVADDDLDSTGFEVTKVNGSTTDLDTEITLGSGALLTLNSDGTFDYNPNGQFENLAVGEMATDSFTYTIEDTDVEPEFAGASATGTVTIYIMGANDGPTAIDDTLDVNANDGATTVDVLANDSDLDTSDTLEVTGIGSPPTAGTANFTVGDASYNPNGAFDSLKQGETATDSFNYQISDGNGGTASAAVNVTITGVNDAPKVFAAPTSESATEETATTLAGTYTFTDVDNDAVLTVTLTPGTGLLAYSGMPPMALNVSGAGTNADPLVLEGSPADVSSAMNSVQYTGALDIAGPAADSITIDVVDEFSEGPVMSTEVDINITDVNDQPIANPAINDFEVDQDVPFTQDVITGALPGPASESAQTVTVVSVSPVGIAGANASVNPGDGTVTYTPAPGVAGLGTDTFTYTLKDSVGATKDVTVNVTISDVLPVAEDISFTVDEGVITSTPRPNLFDAPNVTGNVSGVPTSIEINDSPYTLLDSLTLPSGATLKIQANGGVQYTSPLAAEIAADSFTYTLIDAEGGEATGTVDITITDVNDNPTVAALTGPATGNEGDTLTFSAAGTTDDDLGAAIAYSYSVISGPAGAMVNPSGNSVDVTFPDNGTYVIEVTASDRGGTASTDTISVTIANVKPTITLTGEDGNGPVLDGGSVNEGQTFILTLGAITDPGTDNVLLYSVNWGDGTSTGFKPYNAAGPNVENHQYQDDTLMVNTNPITVDLVDEDGSSITAGTFNLSVNNLDPTINSLVKTSTGVDEGTPFSFKAIATDPAFGNDPLTYNWDFGDGSTAVGTDGMQTHVYTTGGNYTVTLEVTDGNGGSDTETLDVFVNSLIGGVVDDDPTDNEIIESSSAPTMIGLTGLAVDPDGDTVTYSLDEDFGGLFGINPSTGVVSLFATGVLDAETTPSYSLQVNAESSDGSTSSETFTVSVLDDTSEFSAVPIVDADAANDEVGENLAAGQTVGVTASSEDADASDDITYTLSDSAGGLFDIHETTGVVTTLGSLDAESGPYTIEVKATSDDGSFTTKSFVIEVIDDNSEFEVGEIADADTADNEVGENLATGQTVGVTALAEDGDATDEITYSLSDDAGGLFEIHGTTGVVTTSGPLDAEAGPYTIEVTATSDDGSSSTKSFVIEVIDDNTEFAAGTITDADTADDQVVENLAAGQTVGVTAFAEDGDVSDDITYSLSSDAGGLFEIHGTTGVVTTLGLLDAESGPYTIEVTATSDDGSSTAKSFTINVLDVNEFAIGPVTDADGDDNEIDENATGTVGITAFAEDDDASDGVTYTLEAGFNNAEFSIDATTGVVSVISGLDYDLGATRTIEVTATSDDGSFETAQFTISVNDVSESDVGAVTDGNAALNEVAENLAAGATVGITASATDPDTGVDTVTYSLSTNPSGLFAIDANTGVVTTTGPLDAESVTTYIIEVTALSTDGSTSTEDFSIEVLDVDDNDVGPVTDIDLTNGGLNIIPETIGGPGSFTFITAFAEDLDQTNNGITYTLAPGILDNNLFAIGSSSGVVTAGPAAPSPFDAEVRDLYEIEVTATSDDGSFSTATFEITIFDFNDNSIGSVADSDTATANSVDENQPIGTYVGVTAFAEDLDSSDTVAYSLVSGGDNDLFDIDPTTGEIVTGVLLNAEDASSRTVEVVATSTDGTSSSETFVIAVNDVDEFDVSSVVDADTDTNEVAENAVGATVGITASATDDDASDTVTYSLETDVASNNLFDIHPLTGVVTTEVELDFESSPSHTIVVTAESTDGSISTETFTVVVLDEPDSPVGPVSDANVAPNTVAEDAAISTVVGITALAIDPDGDTVQYSLTSNPGGLFAIDSNTGVVTVAGTLDFESLTSHTIEVTATSTDVVTSTSIETFVINVTDVDEVSPEASGVKISAQSWTPGFLGAVDADGIGYAIEDGEILPWVNLDTITIQFNEVVDVDSSDLVLTGFTGNGPSVTAIDFVSSFGVSSFAYDAAENTATWVLGDTFASTAGFADYVVISLNGVTDTAGNLLAPLTVDEFSVNPGDINQDSITDFNDLFVVYPGLIGETPVAPDQIARANVNGDDIVDFNDMFAFYPNRIGTAVPNVPSPAMLPDSLVSLLASSSSEDDDDESNADEVFSDSDGLDHLLS